MYKFLKRLEDIIFSLMFIMIFAPVFVIIAIVLFFTGIRPVIFTQTRAGLNGKAFTIYKFCSMTNARDENGNLLPDKLRLTKVGKFIRKSSLDEFPQFFNVLKGDMSIVGPRPLLMDYLDKYSPKHATRHNTKPGITGLAQVSGRGDLSWQEKLDIDAEYVMKQNFWLDQKIIFLTALQVVVARNSHVESHAKMPDNLNDKSEENKN